MSEHAGIFLFAVVLDTDLARSVGLSCPYSTKVSCLVLFPPASVNVLSDGFRRNRFYLTCIFPDTSDQLRASYWNNNSCLQPSSLKNGEVRSQCCFAGSEVMTNMFASYKLAAHSLILRHLKVRLLYIDVYMRRLSGARWKRAKKKLLLNLFLLICRGVGKYFLHVSHELWLGRFI